MYTLQSLSGRVSGGADDPCGTLVHRGWVSWEVVHQAASCIAHKVFGRQPKLSEAGVGPHASHGDKRPRCTRQGRLPLHHGPQVIMIHAGSHALPSGDGPDIDNRLARTVHPQWCRTRPGNAASGAPVLPPLSVGPRRVNSISSMNACLITTRDSAKVGDSP